MPKRRSLATLKDIKVGQVIYHHVWYYGKTIVERVTIKRVRYVNWEASPFFQGDDYRERSAGDAGVIGCQYDNRPCQLFLNRRSAEYWMKKWGGKSPNFINRHTGCLIHKSYS